MTKGQRVVLYLFAAAVILMGVIPPFHYRNRAGVETNCGHDFVWHPPQVDGNIVAVVDVATLSAQIVLAAIVAGTLYLAMRRRNQG